MDIENGTILLSLCQSFDAEFYSLYIKELFLNPRNIIRILSLRTTRWGNGGNEVSSYETNNSYLNFCSKEEVENAIDTVISSRELFGYDIDTQRAVAAFLITEHHQEFSVQIDLDVATATADAFLQWLCSTTLPICYSEFTYEKSNLTSTAFF